MPGFTKKKKKCYIFRAFSFGVFEAESASLSDPPPSSSRAMLDFVEPSQFMLYHHQFCMSGRTHATRKGDKLEWYKSWKSRARCPRRRAKTISSKQNNIRSRQYSKQERQVHLQFDERIKATATSVTAPVSGMT